MEELASVSGGKAFQPKGGEGMRDTFESIALELRRQYSIAFFPSGFTPDGRKRQIRVKVATPGGAQRLTVRYRKAYYAVRDTPAHGKRDDVR